MRSSDNSSSVPSASLDVTGGGASRRGANKRNVTLSMPTDLLRAARRLAVEQGTSLSGLLIRAIEQLVRSQYDYQDAMLAELRCMEQGFPLGTRGQVNWTRDEIHER